MCASVTVDFIHQHESGYHQVPALKIRQRSLVPKPPLGQGFKRGS